MSTRAAIAKTEFARRDLAMTDADFRAALFAATGKTSRKDCSEVDLARFLDHLRRLGWKPVNKASAARPSHKPYVRLIFGLWSELGALGALDDRSRKALISFVERQTGVGSPDWLTPKDATKVIEALKAWIARAREAA